MLDIKYSRRDILRIGGISTGMSLLGLSDEALADTNHADKSVIWLWMGGGPTHIETFNPIPDAPVEYRSINGSVETKLPGVRFGSLYPKMGSIADKLSIVRSFTHGNSDHERATHYVMTGYQMRAGLEQTAPSLGSIVSNVYGPSSSATGLPLYTADGRISSDGASWIGGAYNPFDINSEAKKNFMPQVEARRLDERAHVLAALDKFHKDSEYIKNLNKVKQQAYDIVLGKARQAFETKNEPKNVQELYGEGLGQRLLLARRLIEYGSRFVTIHYGGWDMHSGIQQGLSNLCPNMDNAVYALITDLERLGLTDKVLLVITGEFGRTPKINKDLGRDHWGNLGTLVFAGGKYQHGRVIGSCDDKATEAKDNPIKPVDVVHTIFNHMGLDTKMKKVDTQGRPRNLVESPSKLIL